MIVQRNFEAVNLTKFSHSRDSSTKEAKVLRATITRATNTAVTRAARRAAKDIRKDPKEVSAKDTVKRYIFYYKTEFGDYSKKNVYNPMSLLPNTYVPECILNLK